MCTFEMLDQGVRYTAALCTFPRPPRPSPSLTLMILKTLRAAVTDAWIFLMLPGSPADRNRHAYCKESSMATWGERSPPEESPLTESPWGVP